MYRRIKAIIAQHPRHQHALLLCLNQSSSLDTIAHLVGEQCRALGITDFRNPFPADDEKFGTWNKNFGLQAQEFRAKVAKERTDDESKKAIKKQAKKAKKVAAKPDETDEDGDDEDAPFDWKGSTKEQIEQHVLDATGENLNTRMKKADLIKKGKATIKAAAA